MTTVDYSKKKNAELEELLRSRSLPHTGKKADLVARLQEYDNAQHSLSKKPAATTGGEDEIDWDDDAPTTIAPTVGSDPASTAAIAAGGQGQIANPAAVPNQVVDTDPSKTDDLTVDPPAPIAATEAEGQDEEDSKPAKGNEAPSTAPPTDFTSGLSVTSLDDEIAKRQKRAARFNLKENDGEALKSLERAKKFGTGSTEDKTAIRGLDEALPERVKKERGVKRGREEQKEVGGEAKRRESGKRNSGRQARSTSRSNKNNGSRYNRSGSRPKKVASQKTELTERDRLASEARKKRFAQAG